MPTDTVSLHVPCEELWWQWMVNMQAHCVLCPRHFTIRQLC